jgi:hypothetical protein
MLFFVVALFLVCSVSALGVARPFFKDNTFDMDANETQEIKFQLQNMESSEKRMVFKVNSQHTMEIEGGDYYEKQFVLGAGELKDVVIEFYSEEEGLFRVDYSYVESCSSSSGDVCFNTEIQDSFFIQVGDDDTYWGFDIPLVYAGFRLYTEARSPDSVTDLKIIKSDGLVDVDYSGQTINLRNFESSSVSFGDRKVTISASILNKPATISMYQIENNYVIYKNGEKCGSDCVFLSYSSKRLRFKVDGFSTYEVEYESSSGSSSSGSGSSSGSSSSGSSGIRVNTTVTTPVTPVTPVKVEPEPKEPEPIEQEEEVNVSLANVNPFLAAQEQNEDKVEKITEGIEILPKEGKNLLTRTTLLGLVSLIAAVGLLFYYKKYQGDSK